MNYITQVTANGFSALKKQISVGRIVYGLCLGFFWGSGNVFFGWLGDKIWPPQDPFWQLSSERLQAEEDRLERELPEDMPVEDIFREDELSELNAYIPEGETDDAMSGDSGDEYMSKEVYLVEVEKCERQIKEIIKKAKEDGKLPPRTAVS